MRIKRLTRYTYNTPRIKRIKLLKRIICFDFKIHS
jgi:hypothetical protein